MDPLDLEVINYKLGPYLKAHKGNRDDAESAAVADGILRRLPDGSLGLPESNGPAPEKVKTRGNLLEESIARETAKRRAESNKPAPEAPEAPRAGKGTFQQAVDPGRNVQTAPVTRAEKSRQAREKGEAFKKQQGRRITGSK